VDARCHAADHRVIDAAFVEGAADVVQHTGQWVERVVRGSSTSRTPVSKSPAAILGQSTGRREERKVRGNFGFERLSAPVGSPAKPAYWLEL
jgi:hypothetical protein